jgi:ATP synthase protein I
MSEQFQIQDLPKTHEEALQRLAAAMLRWQVRVMVPALVVCVVLFTVVNGTAGLLGSVIGSVTAVASSLFTFALMRVSAKHGPYAGLAAALGGFIGKMIILLVVFTPLRDVAAIHAYSLAITMLAGVLTAAGADMVAFRRTKLPTIIPS